MRSSGASTSPTSSVASLRAGVSRILLLLLVASTAGCPASRAIEIRRSEAPPKVDLSLGPGDVFDVRIFGENDLSGRYRVGGEGAIEFPLIGALKVAGLAPAEVGALIARRLRDGILRSPQVSIFVVEQVSKKVHILGQVAKPGTFAYAPGMNIVEAITQATASEASSSSATPSGLLSFWTHNWRSSQVLALVSSELFRRKRCPWLNLLMWLVIG